jgi:hypothetical protein
VTTLNADHLIEQAERLIVPPRGGSPRQVDLRRAISAAYYGVFHFCLTMAADELVGVTQRATSRYALVYRSINHRSLRELCLEAQKRTPPARFLPYAPGGGFGADIQAFAAFANELQQKRHLADYDPLPRLRTSDAKLAIDTARTAILRFQAASEEHRKAFLTLLVCPPR